MTDDYSKKLYKKYTGDRIYDNPLHDPFLHLINSDLSCKLRIEQINFINELTLYEMNDLTEDILNTKLKVCETGFDDLFRNKNTKLLKDSKLIEILEIFLKRQQRLFEYTYYRILPYSDKVRDWVFKNLNVDNYEVCVEDKENY